MSVSDLDIMVDRTERLECTGCDKSAELCTCCARCEIDAAICPCDRCEYCCDKLEDCADDCHGRLERESSILAGSACTSACGHCGGCT